MIEPTVSIVIPAYNHADYLLEAIESVRQQTYPHVELIVINDGSTDNTAQVLRDVADDVKVVDQENKGQAKTLEIGWDLASGSILGYLSADDYLAPDAVSRAVDVLKDNDEVVATYCDYTLVDRSSRPIRKVLAPTFDYLTMLSDVVCPPGPGAFFLASAYESSGPWNPAYRQMPDYDFWLRLGLEGNFIRIEEPLAFFRVHEESQTYSVTTPERASEPVEIISSFFNRDELSAEISGQKSTTLAKANLISAQLHWRAGRYKASWACLKQVVNLDSRLLFKASTVRLAFNAIANRFGHRLLWSIKDFAAKRRA